MNASYLSKMVLSIPVIAAALVLATCELGQPPPPLAKVAECNGEPDWCLLATSEMVGGRAAYVYIDGKLGGLVLPGKTTRFPVAAGNAHEVEYCAVFDQADHKRWECTIPISVLFDKDNATFAVSPANPTLIACDPNRPC